MGCVPVYIGDRFWLPYNGLLDWNEFAVLVNVHDVGRLPSILKREDAKYEKRMQRLHDVQRWFTHDTVMDFITGGRSI